MTSSAISTSDQQPSARRGAPAGADGAARAKRRRVPNLVWGALGALAAGLYAALAERLRFGPQFVMLVLGGMTLALTAAALWRVIDPLTRADSERGAADRGRRPRRIRELEREKQLVLKAIKEIELDFQMRKIAERDYRDMVERYRARALRVMTELEAGEDYRALIERELALRVKLPLAAAVASGAAAAPARAEGASVPVTAPPGTCAACGLRNDEDARFCKQCGAKLGAPPSRS